MKRKFLKNTTKTTFSSGFIVLLKNVNFYNFFTKKSSNIKNLS